MFSLLPVLLTLMPFLSHAGPVVGGGGGMPMPPEFICAPVAGNVEYGTYSSTSSIGAGSGNILRIDRDSMELRIEGPSGRVVNLKTDRWQDGQGRHQGRAKFGRENCEVLVTITTLKCGEKMSYVANVPFWLNEYLWTPERFGTCEGAMKHPDNDNASPSGIRFKKD